MPHTEYWAVHSTRFMALATSSGANKHPKHQISYGATDSLLSDRVTFPYFFRTVQSDHHHYFSLCKLLKYFGWNWIGIITSDDENGEKEQELLVKYLSTHGICVEFTIKIKEIQQNDFNKTGLYEKTIDESSANIIILCGTVNVGITTNLLTLTHILSQKTIILSSKWESFIHVLEYCGKMVHGSLVFSSHFIYPTSMYRFRQFAAGRHPLKYPRDILLKDIFMLYFCMPSNHKRNRFYHHLYPIQPHNCSGEERLTDLAEFNNTHHYPSVFLAVRMMSHGLQSLISKQTAEKYIKGLTYRHQLHHYLKKVTFPNTENQTSYFDENGEFFTQHGLHNLFFNDRVSLDWRQIGMYTPWAQPDQKLRITLELIRWKTPDNKETTTNNLLHAESQHPTNTISWIPVGQYLRLRRICSTQQARKLYTRFKERGYTHNSLKKDYKRALDTDRQDLLVVKKNRRQDTGKDKKVFRLIGDYNAEHNEITKIIKKHWHILHQDHQLSKVIGMNPLITYRRSKNLHDKLTHSHYTCSAKPTWLTSKITGCYKCGNCIACPLVERTSTIILTRDNIEYKLKNYMNCKSTYIVYIMQCICGKHYVGKTLREFRRRIQEHVGDVKHKRNTSVAVHINEYHNGNTSAMKFMVVEQLNQTSRVGEVNKKLLQTEARWIYAMNSRSPVGLNEGFTFSPFL
ncbi:hypothetical protein XELAEV_18004634mg [Xenopus laevis]|uniref:GIY-YIG domain-containing protein n=1 Tax=Xenopus laevis TaxID=8355 RepID=A0A974GZR0_XENLA|nr:hypothetical protein XELAEV_18004634mg [Xenopus laevis]